MRKSVSGLECQGKRHKAGIPENLRGGCERGVSELECLKEHGMPGLQEDR